MRAELTGHEFNGTFSADVVPKGIKVVSAKWVFTWKTDSGGLITKAKTKLVARGFGQRHSVVVFRMFVATPSVSDSVIVLIFSRRLHQRHRYRPSKW